VADTAVANASPLIFLSRAGHFELLHHFAERVLVPRPVADEIRLKGEQDITAKAVDETSWIEVVPAPATPEEIGQWGLGPGEAAVLAIAIANRAMEAVIDDLAGRKCAAHLGIPVRGTLGIVLFGPARIMTYWVPWAACPPLHPGSGRQAAAGTPIIGKAGLNSSQAARADS